MAIEPTAVTTQESNEIAPTCAMLVGNMMMPEPIMFTATMNVSCIRFIFFCSCITSSLSLSNHVGIELDATVLGLLVHALHLIVEARETVERLFERLKV